MAAAQLGMAHAPDGGLRLVLAGAWRLTSAVPTAAGPLGEVERRRPPRVTFEAAGLEAWDSALLTFLRAVEARCAALGVEVDTSGLPEGVRRLLMLATAPSPAEGGAHAPARGPWLERVGDGAVARVQGAGDALAFLGEVTVSALRALVGRARFRRSELLTLVQDCGARSLPIVALLSLLLGLILAFVGAIQLRLFGAELYVADLVGIGIVRELGAVLTGIIVTGRIGASFAAELGTMQVNEEIDALRTLGIDPVDFLVLPRIVALALMMPLLCLYADVMGVLGGLVVGVSLLDLGTVQYLVETQRALHLGDLFLGLFMSLVFGVLVALTGCQRGLACGRSAAAVGGATTSAVVSGIVSVVVATAAITVLAYVLGI